MKVLFAAPHCLLDPSGGAALACRSILEQLAERGHKTVALGCTVFDRPAFKTPHIFLNKIGAKRLKAGDIEIWQVDNARVRHLLIPVKTQQRENMTATEQDLFYFTMKDTVVKFEPDLVLVYGGRISDLPTYRWLKDSGIPIVFYLANAKYGSKDTFRDVSAIITDSQATAQLYKERLGIDVQPVGLFMTPFPPSKEDRRSYCTFSNPEPQKGVALFVAIARESLRRQLNTKFMVVESRAKLSWYLDYIGMSEADLPNVKCVSLQWNMRSVWSRTKIFLHPSFGHESGSRSILEALSANIPCLATRSGGVEQMLGDSGRLFPVPVNDPSEYLKIPESEVVRPWVDCLENWLEDEAAYAAESERARQAWALHKHCNKIEDLEKFFRDLL